jgi:cytochrome c
MAPWFWRRADVKLAIAGMAVVGLIYAGSALAVDMPPEVQDFHCDGCHAIDHRILGPSWMDVSERYKGKKTYKYSMHGSDAPDAREYPLVDGLVMKISRGGAGNWGSEPMIANNALRTKQGEIRRIVKFILGLAK